MGLPTATPGPWSWIIHDGSMASLVGLDEMRDHVLSVSPCRSCVRDDWEWGRCTTPSERDAHLIAAAPTLLAALQGMVALCEASLSPDSDVVQFALATARQAMADAASSASGGEGSSRNGGASGETAIPNNGA